MNKSAIIRTQLIRQVKALLLFLVFYCIVLGSVLVFSEYGLFSFDFEYINGLFIVYLVFSNWLIFSKNLLFYSYHSFGRLTILNRTVIVQFIISFISSLLIEGHYILMNFVSGISNSQFHKMLKGTYIASLTSNEYLTIVIIIIVTALAIFSLLLLTDLVVLLYNNMKKKKAISILILMFVIVIGIFISLPYWPDSLLDIVTIGGKYALGINDISVPGLVMPITISLVVIIISYLLCRKYIRKIEVHQNIYI